MIDSIEIIPTTSKRKSNGFDINVGKKIVIESSTMLSIKNETK